MTTNARTAYEFRGFNQTLDSRAPYGYYYYRIVVIVPVDGQMDSREPGGVGPPTAAPIWSAPSQQREQIILSVDPPGSVAYTLRATDPDGKSVTYTLETGTMPAWLRLEADGRIFVNAVLVDGTTSGILTFRATDGDSEYTVSAELVLSVDFPAGYTWGTVPTVAFVNSGEEQRYSLAALRPAQLPNIAADAGATALPAGFTIDDASDQLVYDGSSAALGTTSGHRLTASDT
jgi:hypothetical protein